MTADHTPPPENGLRCRVGAGDGWTMLVLEGELDFSQSHMARRALLSVQLLRRGRLALDLRGLTFMDTSGVRLILEAMHRAEDRGAEFAIVRGPQAVHDVLELVGLAEQLRVVADPAELTVRTRAAAPPPPAPAPPRRARDIVQAIGHTPLVELERLSPKPGVRIWAKLESHNPTGSVKDRVARALIEDAEEKGAIQPGQTILEPAAGNLAISLAMVCRRKGYRLKIGMPDDVAPERLPPLRLVGAEIDRTGERAHYTGTGAEILDELGEISAFVAALGTGGTLMGAGRRLREELGNRVTVVAAAPHDGLTPPVLDATLLDHQVSVTDRDAIVWTRRLLDEEGIFAGVSSGAAASVAVRIAAELEEGDVVFVVADGGWKYLSSGLYTRPLDELDAIAWW